MKIKSLGRFGALLATCSIAVLSGSRNSSAQNLPAEPFRAVACSADGRKLIAGSARWHGDPLGGIGLISGAIFTSADFGATWKRAPLRKNPWVSVASSADGTKLVAAAALSFVTTTSYWAHVDVGGSI